MGKNQRFCLDPKNRQYCETDRQREIFDYTAIHGSGVKVSAALRDAGGKPIIPSNVEKMVKRIVKNKARREEQGLQGPDEAQESSDKANVVVDKKVVSDNVKQIGSALGKKQATFVVTWAQNATPVHTAFLASLKQYCKAKDATLVVIPGRYKNATSIWTSEQEKSEYWAEEISPFLMNERIRLNPNIMVMADIKIQPTGVRPLSGFDTITGDSSGLFGAPKIQLKTVATPQNKLPKVLSTTGAVTIDNYSDTKAGKKGEFHHSLGAVVVEVRDEHEYHMRHILATDEGTFIDLDMLCTPTGVGKAPRPLALVMGDIHTEFMCPMCEDLTFFKDDGIIPTLNPEAIVLHDWYDGYSGSHHHHGKIFTKFAKHHSGRGNVEEEIRRTFERTKKWMATTKADFYIVGSNHNEHLTTWLEKGEPKHDPENALFYHKMMVKMLEKVTMEYNRASIPNPLQLLCEEDKDLQRLWFVDRDESLVIDEIECSQHGDKGANGARGSINQFDAVGVKTITGHSHSPGIEGGAYRVGTNSVLRMEYNDGLSGWLNTDCLIYANGKRALIHKINGKWRL